MSDRNLQLHRCVVCGARWLLWPAGVNDGKGDASWSLLDQHQKPGACCDNAPMGGQIEHLRDLPLTIADASGGEVRHVSLKAGDRIVFRSAHILDDVEFDAALRHLQGWAPDHVKVLILQPDQDLHILTAPNGASSVGS